MPWTTATTRSSGFAVTAAVWNAEHVDNMRLVDLCVVWLAGALAIYAAPDGWSWLGYLTAAVCVGSVVGLSLWLRRRDDEQSNVHD